MTQYCGDCRGALNSLVEMVVIKRGLDHEIYQCPACTTFRRVDLYPHRPNVAKNITREEAEQATVRGSTATALIIKTLLGR